MTGPANSSLSLESLVSLAQSDSAVSLLANPMFMMWGGVALVGVVSSVGYFWAQARRADAEAMLKREMILRGMSAEDIERVIKAHGAQPESE